MDKTGAQVDEGTQWVWLKDTAASDRWPWANENYLRYLVRERLISYSKSGPFKRSRVYFSAGDLDAWLRSPAPVRGGLGLK